MFFTRARSPKVFYSLILRSLRIFYLAKELLLHRRKALELGLGNADVATLSSAKTLTTLPRADVNLADATVLDTGRALLDHGTSEEIDEIAEAMATDGTGGWWLGHREP